MAHERKSERGALRASQESQKRTHAVEDMGDDSAPWGQGKFANMPTEVEMEIYPKEHPKRGKALDDTIRRLDGEDDQMYGRRSRYVSDQH